MLNNLFNNLKKKSLIERFLLVITILVFLAYFFLGIMVIFWDKFPFNMQMQYRIALGVVLISYAVIRFFRVYNANKE
jgi:succinate dehydrogenase/fumarate reductase cytochrome b subunit